MPRKLTTRQRVLDAHSRGDIDADEMARMLDIERKCRPEIRRMFAPLKVTPAEFFARHEGIIKCNTSRKPHNHWQDIPFTRNITVYGVAEAERCVDCGTEKVNVTNWSGVRTMNTRYYRPDGYSLLGLFRALTQADRFFLRQELKLRRDLAKIEGAAQNSETAQSGLRLVTAS